MEFVKRYVPANFNIFYFGDIHIGTLLHNATGFRKFIDLAKSPYDGVSHNVLIGMGDYIEAIDHSDKRFDVRSVDLGKIRPDMQIDHFQELVEPIKSKIVVLLDGNHEYKLIKYFPYVQRMCTKLQVPYGTFSSVVSFFWRPKKGPEQLLFKTYVTHGNGSIKTTADDPERQEANLNLSLKRKLKHKAGDCVIMAMGHTHKLLVVRPKKTLYLTSNGERLKQNYTGSNQSDEYIPADMRWYLNTGSFLRTYMRGISGYAERAMYDPAVLGCTVAKIRNTKVVDCEKLYF